MFFTSDLTAYASFTEHVGGITDLGESIRVRKKVCHEFVMVCHGLEARVGLRIDRNDELLSAMHRLFPQFPVFASGDHDKLFSSHAISSPGL